MKITRRLLLISTCAILFASCSVVDDNIKYNDNGLLYTLFSMKTTAGSEQILISNRSASDIVKFQLYKPDTATNYPEYNQVINDAPNELLTSIPFDTSATVWINDNSFLNKWIWYKITTQNGKSIYGSFLWVSGVAYNGYLIENYK